MRISNIDSIIILTILFISSTFVWPVAAHPSLIFSEQQTDRLSISLQLDNDVPYSDEKYTSGIYISTELPSSYNILWHQNLKNILNQGLSQFSPIPKKKIFTHSQLGFSIFHQMYTPKRYWVKSLLKNERPFASWFAAGINYDFYSSQDLLNFAFAFGTFGNQWNMAQTFQDFAHTYVSAESPLAGGWHYQISGLAAFNTALNWKHQLLSLNFDNIQFFELATLLQSQLGMLKNSVHLGLIGQLGIKPLNLQGKPKYLRHDFFENNITKLLFRQFTAYIEVGLLPELAIYDSTLQGLPWNRNWHTATPRYLQAHIWGGLKLQAGFVALSFFLNWKSAQTILISDLGQTYWSFKATTLF